ncbi:hypothetical protein [Rivularia sp. PCC 7116]|nr:hypothetical protein [Rivularia sp. PCC 7116]
MPVYPFYCIGGKYYDNFYQNLGWALGMGDWKLWVIDTSPHHNF